MTERDPAKILAKLAEAVTPTELKPDTVALHYTAVDGELVFTEVSAAEMYLADPDEREMVNAVIPPHDSRAVQLAKAFAKASGQPYWPRHVRAFEKMIEEYGDPAEWVRRLG